MASYTPYNFGGLFSGVYNTITSFTGVTGTIYVIRTIEFSTSVTGAKITLSIGADAQATRIFDAYVLTANVPSIFNGWWDISAISAHTIDMKSDQTVTGSVVVSINGYSYA